MRSGLFGGVIVVVSAALGCVDLDAPGACGINAALCLADSSSVAPDAADDVDDVLSDEGVDGESGADATADAVSDATLDEGAETATSDADAATDAVFDTALDASDAGTLTKGWHALPSAPASLVARVSHTAVWTGTEMIVFGGATTTDLMPPATDTGAAYNPTTNKWRTIAAAPSKRMSHAAVWSGSKMIVWGGTDGTTVRTDGAAYDPVSDTWTVISACPLSARDGMGAVWSTVTNEFIVWGGAGGCSGTSGIYCADGAAYSPAKDEWNMLPVSPLAGRTKHAMVWTGATIAIWGGAGKPGTTTNDGALYDPLAKTWTMLAAAPSTILTDKRSGPTIVGFGNEFYIWGGQGSTLVDGSYYRNDGAHLKITSWASSFAALPATVLTTPKRALATGWFGAGKFFVWSGLGDVGGGVSGALAGGAAYDPNFDTWAAMLNTGEPAKRLNATVVWTGKAAIVFGGKDGTTLYRDGGMYVP